MPSVTCSAASNFASAAEIAGIQRIIYFGELVDPTDDLSPYLRSRHETGHILRLGSVPVTEFRAGMVVGSGSALFEMIRYTAERQPVFICPKWFFSLAQPIAIRNVLDYLTAALDIPESSGKLIEIGGATRLTYAQMLLDYSHERGLKRLLIPFPFYAPRLSAYWVHMVTPVHWRVILPLIEGLHCRERGAGRPGPASSSRRSIRWISRRPCTWRLGGWPMMTWKPPGAMPWSSRRGISAHLRLTTTEGMMLERRRLVLDLPPAPVFCAYTGLGGERGWLYLNWTWQVRGWMDKLVGGVGLRRGRRHPDDIRVGEALDFWRVEAVEPDRLIRLRAEMKVPGKAWLEFQSIPQAGWKNAADADGLFCAARTGRFPLLVSALPHPRFYFQRIDPQSGRAGPGTGPNLKVIRMTPDKLILVTGVTGYVGGCLVPRLLEKGYRVRVLVRDPALSVRAALARAGGTGGRAISSHRAVLDQAMQGVSAAYYLVHNMSSGRNYHEREIESARNFASAAECCRSGTYHLPGRAGRPGRGYRPAPALAHPDRRCPAAGRCAGDRVPRQPDHRLRQHFI